MKNFDSTTTPDSPQATPPPGKWSSLWRQLSSKRIAYLTLPLLVMATVVEFVILATGWKYQQAVCLPQGMGVTFFGIGPIGATILAVELLKLPLAIWTASRQGWAKAFMLCIGLPLICVLTFQLVKDMAVYEMGTAMKPASQFLEQAATEEIKIAQLNGNLEFIGAKRAERERKLTELAARKAKAKADFEEQVKRNEEARQDAISLTDYQKRELSDMEIRQSTLIRQFDADAAQITKAITELRTQREAELVRATKWNAEEARLENAYKAKLADYTNKKAAYDKDKAEYDGANVLKRQLLKEPVSPGVPPEREANTVLKPTAIAEIDAQISAKSAELLAINSKRRDGVAQVGGDARKLRDEFDKRSTAKRAETDRKREELSAAQAALAAQWLAEEKQIEAEFAAATQKVDGIRAELDAARARADGFYEAREAAIKNTQVHRIATTVEIVRGLLLGERPVSITASAKERGDLLTDQISMVRIWVYPVLAFIVAFLPTLMVEIGFSTLFKPEQKQPKHRLGFFGRRLHWLYIRAGRQKILRAERLANEVSATIAARDEALAATKATAEKALAKQEAELQAVRQKLGATVADHAEVLKQKEDEWVAKFAGLADSLNRAVAEQDALRDFQKTEIERQVQQRQNAWSERLTQVRQELEAQRAAHEAERTALVQEQHQRIQEVTEDAKTQVILARRQAADAELAGEERAAKLAYDLKEAQNAAEAARSQSLKQSESVAQKLTQAREDAARELEKAARQEKYRLEQQQLEFAKTLRQREADFEHRVKQREQELSLAAEARLAEEQTRLEQEARRREEVLERQLEARVREVDARWKQEVQQRDDAAQVRLKQRELQLLAQAEVRLSEAQTQAEQQVRRREVELQRQLDAQAREAATRGEQELQQKDLALQAKLKQREQEFALRVAKRETELQNQWVADLHVREEEWERQAEARVRATETRLVNEAQQKEELFQSQLRQRDQQWQTKLDALRGELQAQAEQQLRRRESESADAGQRALRELEATLRQEMQQRDEAALARTRQREQELTAQLAAQAEARQLAAQAQWETEAEKKARASVEHFKSLLARAEQERDEAKEFAAEGYRQVQNLEKKLTDASSLLTGWKNGKSPAPAPVGKDTL